ncbi:hypothetical protein NXC14_CH02665 [Rhizobium sp. NXC14]|nr:hypothetical protein NXC14_CH02665 [Rhizobium sp. NXC14]
MTACCQRDGAGWAFHTNDQLPISRAAALILNHICKKLDAAHRRSRLVTRRTPGVILGPLEDLFHIH